MNNIEKECIECRCTGGAILTACIEDAIKLAMEQRCNVAVEHNERRYEIIYVDLVSFILRQHQD